MALLTDEQLAFLRAQKISLSLVLDASGLKKPERLKAMNAAGAKFYYGGALCQKGGHSLRTKAGHCVQCDTSTIAYQLRSSDGGFVYLAYSQKTGYVKVGFSKFHPQDRGAYLRDEAYGNVTDWDVKRVVQMVKDAGRMEFAVHEILESHRKPIVYKRPNGIQVECREVFSCSLEHALATFDKIVGAKGA